MKKNNLDQNIDLIINEIGNKSPTVVKKFLIGKRNAMKGALIYVNALVDKNILDRDILNPLMLHADTDFIKKDDIADFICQKYIPMCNAYVEDDIQVVIEAVKSGKTVVLIDKIADFIIADTSAGEYRAITDPVNESSVKGPREGFVENLETNVSILRRNIKDMNLAVEYFTVGRRSQTSLALVYIEDIVDNDLINEVKRKINLIDVDFVTSTGMIEQYIEDNTYSVFPQSQSSERPDIIQANLMEGRIAIILSGTPFVVTIPALFVEFFQAVEDYYTRTIIASFGRILRIIAAFIIITLPSLYLTLINYNVELLPVNFINPIVLFRKGIALPPFIEIITLELLVEFLREGGLRLPSRIAQTLSIVGGIIIGNTAVQSKIVSPTTLLVVGVTVVATFLIPNYQMSLTIRFLRFPMLILTSVSGLLGISAGWFFILVHLLSLKSFGVPYFTLSKNDFQDMLLRYPLWQMKKRPESIPNNNPTRQGLFREKIRRKK